MKRNKRYLIILLFTILFVGFKSKWTFLLPHHFPTPHYNFKKEELTEHKIELGRVLFHDPILSKDRTISCASCHSPYNAFAHTDHALSHGINDSIGRRNAPALFNLAWQKSFMWDGAINHIEVQALAPITDRREMAETIENVTFKLNRSNKYRTLFYNAFQDSSVTGQQLLKALAQFQLSLISAYSKYDKVKLGHEQFNAQEKNGYELFLKNCNVCHQEPLFSNYEFVNNGLAIDSTLNDFGKISITHKSSDSLKFKTPSLRNLSYTYPYMHDGRFTKLNQVLNHYTKGVNQSTTLALELKNGINLTANEKVDLIAFLLTLNDEEFIRNPKFQFPKNNL